MTFECTHLEGKRTTCGGRGKEVPSIRGGGQISLDRPRQQRVKDGRRAVVEGGRGARNILKVPTQSVAGLSGGLGGKQRQHREEEKELQTR